MSLSPKTVLITGVSSGIGYAVAQKFLNHGWQVYGSVRKPGDSNDLQAHEHFTELVFDVTDTEARREAVKQIKANGHQLSILVNNAGIAVSGPLEVLPEAEYRKQFDVNVFGTLGLTQDCLPMLHETRAAFPEVPVRIINMSSVSGMFTNPFTSIYSASKFALESITDGLRRELYSFNIDAVSIAPGPVKTPIWTKARKRNHLYEGTRYDYILDKLESYVSNAEKAAISPEVVAEETYASAIAAKPKTRKILLPKKWMLKLITRMPTRRVDKIVWKNLNNAKRY